MDEKEANTEELKVVETVTEIGIKVEPWSHSGFVVSYGVVKCAVCDPRSIRCSIEWSS